VQEMPYKEDEIKNVRNRGKGIMYESWWSIYKICKPSAITMFWLRT